LTTAGEDPDRVSICWEQHEYALKVLAARDGTGDPEDDDPTWYPVIYGYQGDDIYNEDNWYRANPSLGITKSLDAMRTAARKAKRNPEDERLFRWLGLNQWVTSKLSTWQPLELFDQTVGSWSRADQLGKECYLGLDLSSTTDLTSLAVVFPPQGTQYDWRVFWHNWIPEDNLRERIDRDHVPYDKWITAGHITATPGNVVDYTKVEETILEIKKFYKVLEVPSDRAFAAMLLQRLEQAPNNLVCVDIPQTFKSLTAPMSLVEVLVKTAAKQSGDEMDQLKMQLAKLLTDAGAPGLKPSVLGSGMTHENNLVARWAWGNASMAKNGNGETKLVKEHRGRVVDRTKRIDPIVALINAMARAQFYTPKLDLNALVLSEDWGM
jgi:phage terminase large subunit-like protein